MRNKKYKTPYSDTIIKERQTPAFYCRDCAFNIDSFCIERQRPVLIKNRCYSHSNYKGI